MDTLSDRFLEEYDSTKTCPNLGMRGDPETRFAFPTRSHLCYGVNPPEAVNLAYQENYCLKPIHSTCVIKQKDWKGGLPLEIGSGPQPRPKRIWRYVIFTLVILGMITVFGWLADLENLVNPTGQITPITFSDSSLSSVSDQNDEKMMSPTSIENVASNPEQTPLLPTNTIVQIASTATVHPTWTVQPTLTFTPPPTPGPGLGTPFGVDQVYVIYRVQEGQSLRSLAELYDTSPEAIQAANVLRAGRTVWPGDIIVVPVGQDDPDLVIRFIYQFVNKKTSIPELAAENGVSVEDIRKYNLLGEDEWIPAGRWLILPAREQ